MIWLHLATTMTTLALVLLVVGCFARDVIGGLRPELSDVGLLILALIVGFGAVLHLLLSVAP